MSAKMGRPKKDNPITVHTSVRLDVETDAKLTEYCKAHCVTRGEAVRKAIGLLLEEK